MTEQPRPHVEIYTDGGCDPNPGPGGWGVILRFTMPEDRVSALSDGGKSAAYTVSVQDGVATVTRELSGGDPHTTNNRMELTAAIEALRALKQPCAVDFYTDSEYVQKGITAWLPKWIANNWRRGKGGQPVKNVDLWQALHEQSQRHHITWHWVRGHAGNRYNERADALARAAIPRR